MKIELAWSFLFALALTAVSAGCAFEHSTNVLAPGSTAAPAASIAGPGTSTAASASLVGKWESNALPVLPSASSCGNFQYQITNQTSSTIAGTFTAVCGGGLTLSGTATGQLN